MLRILGRKTSINVRKVIWTCAELGLSFENEAWGAEGLSLSSPEFLALNPNAQIPVLIDDDLVLWESNAICRYLVAQAGREDLLPSSPRERAHVEQWMDWQATDLNLAWRYVFLARVRKSPQFADPALAEASAREWNRRMGILDRHLGQSRAFVAGDRFTLCDIGIALATHRWHRTPMERPTLVHVERWFQTLGNRAGFAQTCTHDMP